MTRLVRDLRLIPVVLLATASLLALKVMGIVVDGGFALTDSDRDPPREISRADGTARPARVSSGAGRAIAPDQRARTSWAHDMFSFPDVTGSVDSDKQNARSADQSASGNPDSAPVANGAVPQVKPVDTKSPGTKPAEAKPADAQGAAARPAGAAPADKATAAKGGTVVPLDSNGLASPGERAVLERLSERRQELDARARELEIRENLVKSAEKRLDSRVNEIKGMESELNGAAKKKADNDAAELKSLVTMYENMKPKDAAKIFNRLDMPVLIAVVSQINPRVMADIMAQMQPDVAQRLTVELASKAIGVAAAAPPAELPKIEGQPH